MPKILPSKPLTSTLNARLRAPRKGSFFDRLNRRMNENHPPRLQIKLGDNVEIMRTYPDNYFDSIVTDPPAGIGFMGKAWDGDRGGRDSWILWMQGIAGECLRVIKPGGHCLVWALPRTSHWTMTAWENAGFEVRDVVNHIFGSGFPKSRNVAKDIDHMVTEFDEWSDEPVSDQAEQWDGWGTALKPAVENWILLRKPISEKNVAANVLRWGVGGINIDATRVAGVKPQMTNTSFESWRNLEGRDDRQKPDQTYDAEQGRWPANVVTDGSDEVLFYFPSTKSTSGKKNDRTCTSWVTDFKPLDGETGYDDSGSAARFFYVAKPSRAEREFGLEDSPLHPIPFMQKANGAGESSMPEKNPNPRANNHPTVKPISLMTYLIKLITPPDGLVLDCFAGTCTTLMACHDVGMRGIGIEIDPDYVAIGTKKLAALSARTRAKAA